MSRRSGQSGHIERKGKWYVVRFWMDDGPKRVHKSEKVCPASGPGKKTKSEAQRIGREIIAASGADSPECLARAEAKGCGATFGEEATRWLGHIQQRKRRPAKPKTVRNYECQLNRWILPRLGDTPLRDVNNPSVRPVVAELVAAGLAAKTVQEAVKVIKLVVANHLNGDGEPVFQRKWNHEFIDLPVVDERSQRRPSFPGDTVTEIARRAVNQWRVLFVVLAATGMRIGEALGIEIEKHISADCRTLTVGQAVSDAGHVQTPKTPNAYREVDVAPVITELLKAHIGTRSTGFLFCTQTGRPLGQRNALRALHAILARINRPKAGEHAFRRFRTTWLRKQRVPDTLVSYWLGHAPKTITDEYTRLGEEAEYRRHVAEEVGLGFEIPEPEPAICTPCTLREPVAEMVQG